ncbi:unnamed protein product [Lathyrus oleraceus]
MDVFCVNFHHGGHFDDMDRYVGRMVSNWKCDDDKWSYFEILGVVKEMGYPGVLEMWYDFVGTLKKLINDFGAIELLNWFKTHGKVDVYIVHLISQPNVVDVVDVQPLLTYAQPIVVYEIPETDIPDVVDDIPETDIAKGQHDIPKTDIAKGQHDIPEIGIAKDQHDIPETDTMSKIPDIDSPSEIH